MQKMRSDKNEKLLEWKTRREDMFQKMPNKHLKGIKLNF